eukprot:2202531-Pleurochrysis_carterae.AAC.1
MHVQRATTSKVTTSQHHSVAQTHFHEMETSTLWECWLARSWLAVRSYSATAVGQPLPKGWQLVEMSSVRQAPYSLPTLRADMYRAWYTGTAYVTSDPVSAVSSR